MTEEEKKLQARSYGDGWRAGFIEGQKAMQERAAEAVYAPYSAMAAKAIRALPIKEE